MSLLTFGRTSWTDAALSVSIKNKWITEKNINYESLGWSIYSSLRPGYF